MSDFVKGATLETRAVQWPLGIVWPYAGRTTPSDIDTLANSGWYLCDGREVNRSIPGFAVIGTIYGNGDSIDTFNVPDYRGRFMRGVDDPTGDNSADRDPDSQYRSGTNGGFSGEHVGSTQEDQFSSHTHSRHSVQTTKHAHLDGGSWINTLEAQHVRSRPNTSVGSTGGSETRPKNIYVNYLIYLGRTP